MPWYVSLISLLNKIAPWLVALAAYMKGKSAAREEVEKANLEKELEYAKIDRDKPDSVDDDLDRMRTGSF